MAIWIERIFLAMNRFGESTATKAEICYLYRMLYPFSQKCTEGPLGEETESCMCCNANFARLQRKIRKCNARQKFSVAVPSGHTSPFTKTATLATLNLHSKFFQSPGREILSGGFRLTTVNTHFLFTSIPPDLTQVCYSFGFCFLNPGTHLIFVLKNAIATEDIAPCKRRLSRLNELLLD